MTTLRIGTRGSALARWQAGRVKDLLTARGIAAELVPMRTSGDEANGPRSPGLAVKGLFTKEIEDALLGGGVDMAVHSLKDLLIELPAGLVLAAVPERDDARDALLSRDAKQLGDLPSGARVGTSSVRRRAAILAQRPDLELVPLRGNVPTRVKRVEQGAIDAAVVALAGLRRLGLAQRAVPLDPAEFVPAPGQGAIAVEARSGDERTIALLQPLDDAEVRAAVEAERAALAGLGVGCNVPIGATCLGEGEELTLLVAVYALDGRSALRAEVPVNRRDPRSAGAAAAAQLRSAGADELIAAATRTASEASGERPGK